MTRNQVIVQFPFTEQSSLDSFLELEEAFIKLFAQRSPYAEVDGHDVGQGKFNIFIVPKGSWGPVLERVHGLLKLRGLLDTSMVAKQLKGSGKFVVAWPADFSGEFGL
jgi:hypothetical protein